MISQSDHLKSNLDTRSASVPMSHVFFLACEAGSKNKEFIEIRSISSIPVLKGE